MHSIQDLFLESFSYALQFDMHFLYALLCGQKFYSCKKWVLHFDAEAVYTFHWGDSKVYVIPHFKLVGMSPFVGVAFLTGLGSYDVCLNLSYFLFCLCHDVRTKYNPFASLRPT
jgi:hypothetical protein